MIWIDFLVLVLTIIVGHNFFRPIQRYPKTLRPNCLLTRHPIVFVHGVKSILLFHNYWNNIPRYLAHHGYDCRVLNLAWRGPAAKRKAKLLKEIQTASELTGKVHIIAHSLGCLDILELGKEVPDLSQKLASTMLISPPFLGSFWTRFIPKWIPLGGDLRKRLSPEIRKESIDSLQLWPSTQLFLSTGSEWTEGSPSLWLQKGLLKVMNFSEPNDGILSVQSQSALSAGIPSRRICADHAQIIGAGPKPKDISSQSIHEDYLDYVISLAENDLVSSK